jgi:hypothetical protein
VKDLYNENYRTVKKEVAEDIVRWKDLPCSWIGRTDIVQMVKLPKVVSPDSVKFLSNSNVILHRNRKKIKIHMELQKILNSQSNPEQKE